MRYNYGVYLMEGEKMAKSAAKPAKTPAPTAPKSGSKASCGTKTCKGKK